jgi:hypothetical protein
MKTPEVIVPVIIYFIALVFWSFSLKGIVSQDWKGLQMVSFDRFEV